MQSSSAATRQPHPDLHEEVKRIKGIFFTNQQFSRILFLKNQSSFLDKSKRNADETVWTLLFSFSGVIVMNCRTCLKINLYSFPAPRTPALIGFLQDKCLLANQMSLETIAGGFVVVYVCVCMPGLWSSHAGFYPEQRSCLKRECTSLTCAIFPGCTWSKSLRPSPTPGV